MEGINFEWDSYFPQNHFFIPSPLLEWFDILQIMLFFGYFAFQSVQKTAFNFISLPPPNPPTFSFIISIVMFKRQQIPSLTVDTPNFLYLTLKSGDNLIFLFFFAEYTIRY